MSRVAKALAVVVLAAAGGFALGRVTSEPPGPGRRDERAELERIQLRERVLELEAHRDRLERGLLEAQRQIDGTGTGTRTGGVDRAAFVAPEVDGLAINACLSPTQCGQAAANFFCRANGFARASDFAVVQGAFRTASIVNGKVACGAAEEEPCRAFDLIVCERVKR